MITTTGQLIERLLYRLHKKPWYKWWKKLPETISLLKLYYREQYYFWRNIFIPELQKEIVSRFCFLPKRKIKSIDPGLPQKDPHEFQHDSLIQVVNVDSSGKATFKYFNCFKTQSNDPFHIKDLPPFTVLSRGVYRFTSVGSRPEDITLKLQVFREDSHTG